MKKLLLAFGLFFTVHAVNAQQLIRCYTEEIKAKLIALHPQLQQQLDDAKNSILHHETQQTAASVRNIITIPVVVHIVHDGDAIGVSENISDAQVQSQINALNIDYRKMNSDTANTPSVFKPYAADIEIEFCLAMRDPSGNPTNGILRHNFGQASYSDQDMYDNIMPQTIWDRSDYLNIYVARLGGSTSDLLGYAAVPGYPAGTDAVVIGFRYFGTIGNLQSPYNKGRTVTHEIGHWLGLIHTWGSFGGCFDDDNISDTPESDQPYYGCPVYPKTSCGSEDMFMNFMDYTNDACMNIFTNGQKTRMRSVLNTVRYSIQLSEGCMPVPVDELDIMLADIVYPYFNACENPLTPVIEVRNNGSQTISSFNVNYQVNGGSLQQFQWTGNLPFTQSTFVTLPSINFNSGSNDLFVMLSNPNNGVDQNNTNNELNISFQIAGNLVTSVFVPFFEGFETAGFPVGWSLQNPNFDRTWEITASASGFGNSSQCMYFDNYSGTASNNPKGKKDALVTLPFNLSGYEVAQLNFSVAYARRNTVASDSLIIYGSTDCGLNWKRIYAKGGNNLATASVFAQPFTPVDSNWRTETVSLANYMHFPAVSLKFENKSDWGNNIYVDDINIEFLPSSVQELTAGFDFNIYPNPSNRHFTIELSSDMPRQFTIEIFDVTGRIILNEVIEKSTGFQKQLELNNRGSGLYIVRIFDGKSAVFKRLAVN
jgi:hypothetical protein